MIRRFKRLFCIILNEPQRLTLVVNQINGTWKGKEIEIGDGSHTVKIAIQDNDNSPESEEIRKVFKRLADII